nr:immunoglobulin heavy chain junction region [Macaca mulatta]MOX59459.1 immunoglobulin heavy chain junction region [Macaca mulatta]MOX59740.1 immunoglobulin heavy chain junction region [Macaca mulatta]MOX59921.1 immunoglobulin heavy chain junction region [Macaca mulatta]MOX60053.1 immunoglobulin heavy chain junction region [Macaca mulatta]
CAKHRFSSWSYFLDFW